jgi:hypothetical protein
VHRRHAAAVALVAFAVSGCIEPTGPPADRFPLKHELVPQDVSGLRVSFTPLTSSQYAIALDFPQPVEDREVSELVDRAVSDIRIASYVAPFAFSWRVLDGDALVSSGTSTGGAIGVIDTGTYGLGGGPLKSRALVFAQFPAQANRTYTLQFKAGPSLTAILRGKPILEVVKYH